MVQLFAANPTFIVQQVKRVSLKVQVIKVFPPTPFDVSLSDHTQEAGMCREVFFYSLFADPESSVIVTLCFTLH